MLTPSTPDTGTAPTYNIARVSDFLNVPADRIDACLEEFGEFLEMARGMGDLARIMGEVTGEDGACKVEAFVWIDDGKRGGTLTIKPTTKEGA